MKPLLVIWDNPLGHSEFKRALPRVLEFQRELTGLTSEELYKMYTAESESKTGMLWKIDFMRAELAKRVEARRVLQADQKVR